MDVTFTVGNIIGEIRMPGRDNTGPMGQGAGTGRSWGFCNQDPINLDGGGRVRPGFSRCIGGGAKLGIGLGIGYGYRRLLARRNQVAADRAVLEKEQELLKVQLDDVTERLIRLSKSNE